MGYKKAFSLLTIQLLLPLSTMTKEEYKATYGIDLNDIDFEKVTLIQKDGSKEKYYVDEVKITEDGADIYAGGNVLSIGESSISVTENAYSVVNAKPIYCHPISIYLLGTFHLSMFIFDNSPTPYNNETLYNKILQIRRDVGDNARFPVTGGFIKNSNLYVNYNLETPTASSIALYGISDTGNYDSITMAENFASYTVTDGVNKIN